MTIVIRQSRADPFVLFFFCREGSSMQHKKATAVLLSSVLAASLLGGCRFYGTSGKPVTLTVWTYYNGDQLASFERLVEEFNTTVGKKEHITVEASSQGNINELEKNVLDAATGKVGALAMPNIFSAYADTAYTLAQMGQVVDLSPYLTEKEKEAYLPNYLEEGDFSDDGSIHIFPVAKSTELLFLNDTDWQPFSEATGASYSDLETIEGLVSTAALYYSWTDAQTPDADDGKALFGRDAMANYILVGARQLGCTIFDVKNGKMTLHFDHNVMRTLWDNYYVPFVKGCFATSGHFRSDDIKTGNVLAYAGSTSSATFFPKQGAGMVVTQGSEQEIKACVTFLKWFTAPENNITFSVDSGYLPVTKDANNMAAIHQQYPSLSDSMDTVLTESVHAITTNSLYTTKPFENGNKARSFLEHAMSDQASADLLIVRDRMEQGQTLEEASAEFLTDDHFEAWYSSTRSTLSTLVDQETLTGE